MVPPLVIYEQYRGQCYLQLFCYKKINSKPDLGPFRSSIILQKPKSLTQITPFTTTKLPFIKSGPFKKNNLKLQNPLL
jgi:hypothetical protein